MGRLLLVSLVLLFLTGCGNYRKATYFKDVENAEVFSQLVVPQHIISEDDILNITINSINEEASEMFNLPQEQEVNRPTPNGNVNEKTGYKVTKFGTIELLLLGNIEVAGLTTQQAQEKIEELLIERKLLLDPVVVVRVMNYKVTVLGEVAKPTVITIPEEKITLLEALGFAGDITSFGKRDNILLLRQEEGKAVAYRIDLNSEDLLNSPFFYLKSDDVIYVEPKRSKIASSSLFYQLLPTIISGLSIAYLVFDRLR